MAFKQNMTAMKGAAKVAPLSMEEEIAKLKAENEALRAAKNVTQKISYKCSEKGALSMYGLGRFPVSLYREQWERLIAEIEGGVVQAFIAANVKNLAIKDDPKWEAKKAEVDARRKAEAAA